MTKKKTNDKTAVPVPDEKTAPVIQVDEFHGIGGSYIIDPATGIRTRIEGPVIVGADSIRQNEQPESDETDEIREEI